MWLKVTDVFFESGYWFSVTHCVVFMWVLTEAVLVFLQNCSQSPTKSPGYRVAWSLRSSEGLRSVCSALSWCID